MIIILQIHNILRPAFPFYWQGSSSLIFLPQIYALLCITQTFPLHSTFLPTGRQRILLAQERFHLMVLGRCSLFCPHFYRNLSAMPGSKKRMVPGMPFTVGQWRMALPQRKWLSHWVKQGSWGLLARVGVSRSR